MTRLAATLPGYASVARVGEVLHLAPRSVRDLIYAGRLPSVRVGRLHYIKAADLDLERRRRLALPLPARRTRSRVHHASPHSPVDPMLRQQRAAERAALVSRWAHHHGMRASRVPAAVHAVTTPIACDACGRSIGAGGGRMLEVAFADDGRSPGHLCLTCGRRALLDWADERRRESAEAHRLARRLGEPLSAPEHASPSAA